MKLIAPICNILGSMITKKDEKIKLIVSSCFSAPHESTFRKVRHVRNPDDYDYHMIHIKAGKIY